MYEIICGVLRGPHQLQINCKSGLRVEEVKVGM